MRDRWTVTLPGGEALPLRGSVSDHEYRITAGGRQVAEVSKRWFRLRNTYGVAISAGEDEALLLADCGGGRTRWRGDHIGERP